MDYEQYQINVDRIEWYIDYLSDFKRKMEEDLADFDRIIKGVHEYWNDSQYDKTIETEEKIASAELELIESIDVSIRRLTDMTEEYIKYLNM